MWDIKNLTGTLYTNHDTLAGHLLQHSMWYDNHLAYGEEVVLWPYLNIMSITVTAIRQHFGYDVEPLTNPIEDYCTSLIFDSEISKLKWGWSWANCLDLMLHDMAVTYTFLAAKECNEDFSWFASTIWGYSRQLRVDMAKERYRSQLRKLQLKKLYNW